MAEVIGVRFQDAGKVYYFDPIGIQFEKGEHAIVETARGVECGFVAMDNRDVAEDEIVFPLKPVIRKATEADLARVEENLRRQKEAFTICEKKIAEHKMDMKLVDVEYTFDNNKILFYFTAAFSPFKHWDPEMGGGSGMKYPTQRVFNIGIQFTFK